MLIFNGKPSNTQKMKAKLLRLIFCVCVFHLAQVQSICEFIHTDGKEYIDDKNCFCGPEKIPEVKRDTDGKLLGPYSNSFIA